MWPTSIVLGEVPALGPWQKQVRSRQLSRGDFQSRKKTSSSRSQDRGGQGPMGTGKLQGASAQGWERVMWRRGLIGCGPEWGHTEQPGAIQSAQGQTGAPPSPPPRGESIAQPRLGNPLDLRCGCHVWEKIQPLLLQAGLEYSGVFIVTNKCKKICHLII